MTAIPALSVIVPTYNRARVLAKCLRALEAQNGGTTEFEVLVSDDGSPDDTCGVVESFIGRGGLRLRYLQQPNSGANAARNRAARAAQAPLLLFINDDTIATPGMIAEHLSGHREYADPRVAVLGRVTVSPELPHSRLAALHLDRAFAALTGRTELDWRSFYTCNVSLKKDLLERGGFFEEGIRYHEDLELSERLSHHGLRVVYRPAALGYHDHFLTEEEFLAVARREARALAAWARKAPHLTSLLGEFGFEPGLPAGRRMKHAAAGLIFNRWTISLWRAAAYACPMESLSLKVYEQVYQSVRRRELRSEWDRGYKLRQSIASTA
jgi:glycosyltransferase involved in cell wall biosynthesis